MKQTLTRKMGGAMRTATILLSVFVFEFLLWNFAPACTTAVISGKATPDGRPLLWKHRDSGQAHNVLRYFNDGIYSYIGIVNADDSLGENVWAGCNSAGFAIMNSASYNLKASDDSTEIGDQEGRIMKLALQRCRSLSDFERLLDTLPKPLGVESNFGVIDAQGGAAYYETDNFSYRKLDVNDSAIAPEGYLIHTNFSFTGKKDGGEGYIRYARAEKLFFNASGRNDLTPRFLLQTVSRNLQHGLTNRDLQKESPASAGETHFVNFRDFIPRHSSVSVMVVQGVRKGQPANQAVCWTILGFPLTTVVLPVWVAAGDALPSIVAPGKSGTAPLCEAALQLKEQCFPIKRGSGASYLNLGVLLNANGTGILQRVLPFESKIIEQGQNLVKMFERQGFHREAVLKFYRESTEKIRRFYRTEFHLNLGE